MGVAILVVAALVASGVLVWRVALGWRASRPVEVARAATHDLSREVGLVADRADPTTPIPNLAGSPSPKASPTRLTSAAPAHFGTLPPGTALPSGSQCTAWVLAQAMPENKHVNAVLNQAVGHRLPPDFFPTSDDPRSNSQVGSRVDGAFRGTTQQILRWVACKWGVDEDIVDAQAAKESWWHQTNLGDWGSDASACPPGHGLGADGKPGLCPQSFGILQNRFPYERGSWPGIAASTAMNADTAYSIWRTCFEGYELWLNDVERGSQYGAGDAWGCVGSWFSGRWHTVPAEQYIASVRNYLQQRIWQQPFFQEP